MVYVACVGAQTLKWFIIRVYGFFMSSWNHSYTGDYKYKEQIDGVGNECLLFGD